MTEDGAFEAMEMALDSIFDEGSRYLNLMAAAYYQCSALDPFSVCVRTLRWDDDEGEHEVVWFDHISNVIDE